jgi:hypothetical protein
MQADEPPVLDRIDVAHGHMEGDVVLSAALLIDARLVTASLPSYRSIDVILVLKLYWF